MGGCNSVLNDVELAGAFVGAGVATVASGGAAAAGAVYAAANVGAYFATKTGCSKDKTAVVNATNQIIAAAIITSINKCTQLSESWQDLNITCAPRLDDPTSVYEANPACGTCITDVFQGMLSQHALERKMWQSPSNGPAQVRTPINNEFTLLLGRTGTCGTTNCKACVMANVTQSNILTSNSACYETMRNHATFTTNLSAIVQQQLLNNQDVLAGLAQALGKPDVSSITETISSTLASKVTENFLNEFVNSLQSSQTIRMVGNGSTLVNNIAQINAFQAAVKMVSDQNIVEQSISNDVFSTIEQVANQQNTLNDVGTLVFQSTVTFAEAINSIVGKVMLGALILLGVMVLGIIAYAAYKMIKKVTTKAIAAEKAAELAQTQSALAEF